MQYSTTISYLPKTVNGQILPPAHNHMELAEHLGQILNSKKLLLSLSGPSGGASFKKRSTRKRSNYASDFGLELESDFSGTESDASLAGKIDVGLVDVLARRLLIAASRTGTGGDAYFIVCVTECVALRFTILHKLVAFFFAR